MWPQLDVGLLLVQSLGLEGFFLALALFYLFLHFSSNLKVSSVHTLGNSKAAAHVCVDLQCWTL